MSKNRDYESRTEELLAPILEEFHFELWDVEYVKEGSDYYLRAYIDKEGGITIDDCVEVSRKLSDKIDAEDFIPEAYILEVSSPGLGRKLVKDKEFAKSIGRDVDIKFYKPYEGSKEISGKLNSFEKDTISILIGEEEKTLNRNEIASVKLSLDF